MASRVAERSPQEGRPPAAAAADTGDYLARVRELEPLLAAAAGEIDRQRELPERIVDALVERGLFRLLLPKSLGGAELLPAAYVPIIEELAKTDASTAWCVNQNSGCSMTAAYLKPEAAREMFGGPRGILAWGPFAPTSGRAVVVEGGYKLTGRWMFASGSRHATWIGCHVLLFNQDGSPHKGEDGRQIMRTMLFPKSSVEIIDNWQVLGLRGTGSDSYAMTDLFVPQRYTFARDSLAELREAGPLFKFTSGMMYAASFSFVSLGIARGALDAFIKIATSRVPRGGQKTMAHNNVTQAEVAKADAKLLTSRAFVLESIEAIWDEAGRGNRATGEQRRRFRLAATWAINQAQEVVNTAYTLAGSAAIFEGHPLERRLRDIHAGTQQGQGRPIQFEHVGQIMLGLEPEGPLFR
jgi:alkylation response protein AidB-like acyl-CoA dehydrogenase